jgi:hypothetical protein
VACIAVRLGRCTHHECIVNRSIGCTDRLDTPDGHYDLRHGCGHVLPDAPFPAEYGAIQHRTLLERDFAGIQTPLQEGVRLVRWWTGRNGTPVSREVIGKAHGRTPIILPRKGWTPRPGSITSVRLVVHERPDDVRMFIVAHPTGHVDFDLPRPPRPHRDVVVPVASTSTPLSEEEASHRLVAAFK